MKRRFLLSAALIFTFGAFASSFTAQTPRPKSISAGVLNGKATLLPKPVYPPAARAVKASGSVNVRVVIDEAGNVVSAEALSGHPLLRSASVAAAVQAKFAPTQLSGEPVKVSGVITYNFVPDPDAEVGKSGLASLIPNADHDKIWALGVLFGFIQVADAEAIRFIGDEQEFMQLLKELSSDLAPGMASYKATLEKLSSPDLSVRGEASRDFLREARKEFDVQQNWQIDAGEQIGFLFGELMRQKLSYVKTGTAYDASILRTHLRRLADLVASAPQDASADNKSRFQKIAAFAEVSDLATDRKFEELMDVLAPLFDELN